MSRGPHTTDSLQDAGVKEEGRGNRIIIMRITTTFGLRSRVHPCAMPTSTAYKMQYSPYIYVGTCVQVMLLRVINSIFWVVQE